MDLGDQSRTFDLVSTWGEDCGIFEYAHALALSSPLANQLSHVFARRLPHGEAGRSETLGRQIEIHRAWSGDNGAQNRLRDGLLSSQSDALWVQYHPSFFADETLAWLGEVLPLTSYSSRILTVHNLKGLNQRAFLNAFSDIVVHNELAMEQLTPLTDARCHIIPHFIYSRDEFAIKQASGPFRVATVGFAAENKRVPHLIDAFSMAHALSPEMRLSVLTSPLGTHSAHFEMSRIVSRIRHCSAKTAIEADLNPKSMPDLLSELSQAHLLCLPYADTTESASGAARLGIAAGVPILRSNSPIFSDLPGGDIILQDDQAETLAEALLILSQAPNLLEQKRAEIDAAYYELNADEIAKRLAKVLF